MQTENRPILYSVITMLAGIMMFGCEKIININIDEANSHLVIEGMITDGVGPYVVKLSKSGGYIKRADLSLVTDAVVIISDNSGTTDTLKKKEPGKYLTSKIKGIPGRTYNLVVLSESIRYTGTSTMMTHIEIDSLRLRKSYPPGIGIDIDGQRDSRVEIHCFFRDPAEKNFYRTFIIRNGQPEFSDFKLYDDQYTNGEETELQVKRAHIGETIRIDLFSLDKSTYEYYRTLKDLLLSNPIFGSTPANPNTNLTNGALGYFGACAVSTKTITITDSLYNSVQ